MKNQPEDYDQQFENPLTRFLDELPRGPKFKEALEADLPVPPGADVRARPPEKRLRYLSMLRRLHIPLNRDLAFWELLLDLLEDSYAGRCPTAKRVQHELAVVQAFSTSLRYADESDIEAIGIALIGMSSVGKTRTMKRLFRRIAQVAFHDLEKSPLLAAIQIIWLRVECPANRSLTALVNAIFEAIEKATKEPIPAKLKKGNQSDLVQNVAALCSHYKLGILVIDEIQHVLNGLGKPDPALLNLLVQLSNQLEVPLLIVGTPLARKVIGGAMRQARRMLGPEWLNLDRNSASWKEFSSRLLSYQFTKGVAPLESIEPTLYDLSQGLPGLAVMLWRLSQRYAILIEMEGIPLDCVTPDIMAAAYADHFEAVRPMVNALRSGDPDLIALYQDLHLDTESLEIQLAQEAADEVEALRMQLFKTRKNAVAKAKRIINTAAMEQAEAISNLPVPEAEAERPLLDAFDKAKEDGEDPGAAVAAVR